MTQLKRRMIVPDLFASPDLSPAVRRLLYAGLHSIAENSGCLPWNPAHVRALVLSYEDMDTAEVAEHMAGLVADGRVWPYVADGREYAFLPDFPVWQSRQSRWQAPEMVPLPPWISFKPHDAKERRGSGTYEWPKTREDVDRLLSQALDLNALDLNGMNEINSLDLTVLDLKEGAPLQPSTQQGTQQGTQRGSQELQEILGPASVDERSALETAWDKANLHQRDRALSGAREQARKLGKRLDAQLLTFYLVAEIGRSDV